MPQQNLFWRNLLTGVFFLLGLVVLVSGLLIVGTNQGMFHQTYELKTYLPDKQALAKGTAVTLSGLAVGTIKDIGLVTYQGQNMVEFDLQIQSRFQARITTSSKALVKSIGVLGDKYMEITLGKNGETPLKDGAILPAIPALDWEKVAQDISGSLQNVLTRTDVVLTRLERGEGSMGRLLTDSTLVIEMERTMTNLDATLSLVREGRGTLGKLVNDPVAYNRLSAALDNLEAVTGRIRKGDGTLGKLINDPALFDRASAAAADADSVLALMHSNQGSIGRALNDPQAYDELHKAITDLRSLLLDMQKNPGRYLKFSVF